MLQLILMNDMEELATDVAISSIHQTKWESFGQTWCLMHPSAINCKPRFCLCLLPNAHHGR